MEQIWPNGTNTIVELGDASGEIYDRHVEGAERGYYVRRTAKWIPIQIHASKFTFMQAPTPKSRREGIEGRDG